ncbi:MAG: metallophosphoesterase [Pseudomonadota bacterium]
MHIHPQLWPYIIGATLGLPLLILAGDALWQRRARLTPAWRWGSAAALGFVALLYGAGVYATFIEPNELAVRRVTVLSDHWRGAPLTIAVLADTHVGSPHVSAARVEQLVAHVDDLHPDLVVLLGDYVAGHTPSAARSDAEHTELTRSLAAFAMLDAPLGVIAVIGNHDNWYGQQEITQALQDSGVAVLRNRNVTIRRQGGAFVIAGLADAMTDRPDFDAALDGAPQGADTIVISHSPDPFPQMPRDVALMLAGHTHCGQVTLPLIGRPVTPTRYGQRYACGRVDENGHTLYVNAGIGTSGLPIRFLNPPELTLITIRAASTNTQPSPPT